MNDYIAETQTDRAILRIGREVIVVADHTKCERTATVLPAPPTVMQILVTICRLVSCWLLSGLSAGGWTRIIPEILIM